MHFLYSFIVSKILWLKNQKQKSFHKKTQFIEWVQNFGKLVTTKRENFSVFKCSHFWMQDKNQIWKLMQLHISIQNVYMKIPNRIKVAVCTDPIRHYLFGYTNSAFFVVHDVFVKERTFYISHYSMAVCFLNGSWEDCELIFCWMCCRHEKKLKLFDEGE